MLIVKIMTECDAEQLGERAQFELFTGVAAVQFKRTLANEGSIISGTAIIAWADRSEPPLEVGLSGPAYVMNEAGKTISTFVPPTA